MKKLLVLTCALAIAQPTLAGNINIGKLGIQADFRNVSEDLGSALSYKGVVPAESMGVVGFDIGVEVTQADLAKSGALWNAMTGSDFSSLYVPKLQVTKGLPFNIDIGAFYSAVPATGISLTGGELRWAFMEGSVAMPAVAVRGALTKLSGVDQLSLDTKSLDVSISKGFAMFTPYAGIGQVWTNSSSVFFAKESFTQSKLFAGTNLNLGIANLALEFDKTGAAKSTSFKLGFRF